MSTPLESKVSVLAGQALAAHGLVLVQARLLGGTGRLTLQVLAEKPDGSSPSLDECTQASRTLSAQLDVADLIQARYMLEVGSPGLERPLVTAADYTRFVGRQAKLSFGSRVEVGGKAVGASTGHIVGADDAAVRFKPLDDEAEITVPYTHIRFAHLSPSAEELAAMMKAANARKETGAEAEETSLN